MKNIKILVCGSRTITNKDLVWGCLDRFVDKIIPTIDDVCFLTVITGGANGTDTLAHAWAQARHHRTLVMRANWNEDGKRAGFIRNERMLQAGPNYVFGFFGETRTQGTLHMLHISKRAGIDTRFVEVK